MEKGVPWSKLLNRDRQLLLNLRLLIEKRVLMILAKAVLKNTDPSIFYEHFKKALKVTIFIGIGLNVVISEEQFDRAG